MRRVLVFVVLVLFLAGTFLRARVTESEAQTTHTNRRRLEFRVSPFVDLYFFVYKLSSAPEHSPGIDGFAQSVEAARQTPITTTLQDLVLFQAENAAVAEKLFAQFPETYKTSKGEVIDLRRRAVHLAKSLGVVEKPFIEKIWPEHKLLIEKAAARIELALGPKELDCFNYLTRHLGMENAERVVPVYLVAQTPWPGGFTMWGKDPSRGVCVLSVTAYQGSPLIAAILHEAIHALDLETKGKGNVLVELRDRLLKAGFAADDVVVRHGPHMLVFIHSSEAVRRYVDSSYQPYSEGVFIRQGLQPIVKVELPLWTAYLDGKISRDEALKQMVGAFVKARNSPEHP